MQHRPSGRRRAPALVAALVVTLLTFGTGPPPAAAAPATAGKVASVDHVARAAIDQAMPIHWPRWRFWAGQGRLALDARFSGGHGSPAQLWDENGADAQLWVQEVAGEGGSYLHPGYDRNLCLGVNTTGWGSSVFVQGCDGSARQRWHIDRGPFGTSGWEIRNVPENLCLDVPFSTFNSGQALQIWGCNHGQAQRWTQLTPRRADGRTEPVYFVPGHTSAIGHNCSGNYWGQAMNALRGWGWTGDFHTVGFYANDVNCSDQIGRHDRGTGLEIIGRELAWDIYSEYSWRGVSVDAIGHSMGGLIVRAAIHGTQARWPGYPPFILVEDAVTLGTPHLGTPWALNVVACGTVVQCVQMREGSDFLNSLGQNPQSAQGTDWTAIGSEDDLIVQIDSATGIAVGHKTKYLDGMNIGHSDLPHNVSGQWRQVYWNYQVPSTWYLLNTGGSVIASASNAMHNWDRW